MKTTSFPEQILSPGLSALSAALGILAFPPFDYAVLGWVALVPLFVSLHGSSPSRACLLGQIFGMGMNAGVFHWINGVGGFRPVDFFLLAVYLGAYYGVFALLLVRIQALSPIPLWIAAPPLWVALEYARGNMGFLALPWAFLGHTQYRFLPAIQVAEFAGVYGVSFVLVTVNALAAAFLIRSPLLAKGGRASLSRGARLSGIAMLLAVVLVFGHGAWVLMAIPGSSAGAVSVSVIQGNIPQKGKWDPARRDAILERHLRLTESAVREDRPSLVVWPETAVPGALPADRTLYDAYSLLALRANAYFLVGSAQLPKLSAGQSRNAKEHNSAFLFSPAGRIVGRYNKIRLLPFGEYLPARDLIPWPSRYKDGVGNECDPGKTRTILPLGETPFSAVICWENLFPDHFRRFVRDGARFMVNITNEAWFGEYAAPYQFLSMAVFRAVENRVALVRSANTGISGFIGPTGEIMGTVSSGGRDVFVEGYLTRQVPLRDRTTFYTRFGDVFAICNVFAAAGLTIYAVWRKRLRAGRLGGDG